MKLNLGCGGLKFPGFVNVDGEAACEPDAVVDLERVPWPWEDSSVEEVRMWHVLEHLGARTDTYLGIIRELYRVCAPGALVDIRVPHPRHDTFLADPTHVRPITAAGLRMFSQKANRDWVARRVANTPLGLYCGVDFEVQREESVLDPRWQAMVDTGRMRKEDLDQAVDGWNNVVLEVRVTLRAIKPAGSSAP